MTPLPPTHWQQALDGMEASIENAIKCLDRAGERWERAAAPSAGEGEMPAALDRLDARLHEWEDRLCAAETLAATVTAELADRAIAIERWRGLFANWQDLIKQREQNTS